MTLNLPIRAVGPENTILDAAGRPLGPEGAAALVGIVNAAWRLALAEQGPVFAWRARHADLLDAVGAAGEKKEPQ